MQPWAGLICIHVLQLCSVYAQQGIIPGQPLQGQALEPLPPLPPPDLPQQSGLSPLALPLAGQQQQGFSPATGSFPLGPTPGVGGSLGQLPSVGQQQLQPPLGGSQLPGSSPFNLQPSTFGAVPNLNVPGANGILGALSSVANGFLSGPSAGPGGLGNSGRGGFQMTLPTGQSGLPPAGPLPVPGGAMLTFVSRTAVQVGSGQLTCSDSAIGAGGNVFSLRKGNRFVFQAGQSCLAGSNGGRGCLLSSELV